MILSHFHAGTGTVLIETREERRLLRDMIAELPATTQICTISAPAGELKNARNGQPQDNVKGLPDAYKWACAAPGRVIVVYDAHTIINNAGQWRLLLDALPGLRSPRNAKATDAASLVVFVGPHWQLDAANPLRGSLVRLDFAPPDREAIARVAGKLAKLNGDEANTVVDALCGLSADAAEQAAAEVLARTGGKWDTDALRDARRQLLKEGGLELRQPIKSEDYGGMNRLKSDFATRVVPWLRDETLSVRRMLWAGVHGTGKTLGAQLLAGMLNCECVVMSLSKLKGGIVGASEANLTRAFRTINAIGKDSPLVVVIDEVDTIAKSGLDGGTSAGMWSILGEHLQYDKSCTIFIGTTNRYDLLDTALTQRFGRGFFFDLPQQIERKAICEIHYKRCGCKDPAGAAISTAELTEGFSAREIAESIVPDVVALVGREKSPKQAAIKSVVQQYTPTSVSQADQLAAVRKSASALRRANDAEETEVGEKFRRIVSEQ